MHTENASSPASFAVNPPPLFAPPDAGAAAVPPAVVVVVAGVVPSDATDGRFEPPHPEARRASAATRAAEAASFGEGGADTTR
jgi:hypothetical protein